MIPKIRVFRDKFFAPLDKESVLSYFRIDPTAAMQQIDCDEIEEPERMLKDMLSGSMQYFRVSFSCVLPNETQPTVPHNIDSEPRYEGQ